MFGAVLLLIAVCAYRVFVAVALTGKLDVLGLNNFSPMAAVALCGAIFLPSRFALAIPFAALFVSDLLLNAHYGVPLINAAMIPQYLAFGAIAALGRAMRGERKATRVLGASVIGSIF